MSTGGTWFTLLPSRYTGSPREQLSGKHSFQSLGESGARVPFRSCTDDSCHHGTLWGSASSSRKRGKHFPIPRLTICHAFTRNVHSGHGTLTSLRGPGTEGKWGEQQDERRWEGWQLRVWGPGLEEAILACGSQLLPSGIAASMANFQFLKISRESGFYVNSSNY